MDAGSWLGLDAFFDSIERGRDPSTGASSETSYTTESSDGMMVDDNYMIITKADAFDEMSDIVDSVATARSKYSSSRKSSSHNSHRRRTSSSSQARLQAVNEQEEDSAQEYEAYLRAKMFSLWGRIQEEAHIEEPSETPTTEKDAKLLKEFREITGP